jgi:hypothetical protein
VDGSGAPVGSFGRVEYMEVRGVVAGAVERLPRLRFQYEVGGVEMNISGGVTRARLGCDLLVSRHDILALEKQGFRLSARA